MVEKSIRFSRRTWLSSAASSIAVTALSRYFDSGTASAAETAGERTGHQRLTLKQLHAWEAMRRGMFIHFGMSTYLGTDRPTKQELAATYAPDQLDVDQWVSAARDAGFKYAVLTVKHAAGHCLWPSKHTDYSVANSGNKTDVFELFVKTCEKRGVKPGFYYCSWDNAHRFGSRTPDLPKIGSYVNELDFTAVKDGEIVHPDNKPGAMCAYTSSMYQDFVTAQMTELLTQYGPITEVWIDIPGVLGRGYRTFLYQHITTLQPQTVVVTNSGLSNGEPYRVAYAWPADVIGLEGRLPPEKGHNPWRTIEGKEYYLPAEVCHSLTSNWFFMPKDKPRPDEEVIKLARDCQARGANLLLNVPPDTHGRIPEESIQALKRLGKLFES